MSVNRSYPWCDACLLISSKVVGVVVVVVKLANNNILLRNFQTKSLVTSVHNSKGLKEPELSPFNWNYNFIEMQYPLIPVPVYP